jgi:hypothetical protein
MLVRGAQAVADGGELDGAVGMNHSRYGSSVSPALPTITLAPERSNQRLIDLPKRKLVVAVTASTAYVPSGRDRRRGRAMEVHVGERADARRQIDSLVDHAPIDALARRGEHSVEIDDVAELQTGQLGVGDRRGQPHFVHPDVVQPLSMAASVTRSPRAGRSVWTRSTRD